MELKFNREDIVKILESRANYLMAVNDKFSFKIENEYDIPYAGVTLELKEVVVDEPEAMMAEEDERTQELEEEKAHYADSTDKAEAEYDKASSNAGEIL